MSKFIKIDLSSDRRRAAAHIGAALRLMRHQSPYWFERRLLQLGAYVLTGDNAANLRHPEVREALFKFADEQCRFILSKIVHVSGRAKP
jgi:hypothetical protein